MIRMWVYERRYMSGRVYIVATHDHYVMVAIL